MSAWLAYLNTQWRIEALTPTESTVIDEPFRWFDPSRVDPESVANRSFLLRWAGSDEDDVPTSLNDRWAEHSIVLEVHYRVGSGLREDDAHKAILSDRHDLAKMLRNPDYFDGTADATPTADTGIKNRVRISDEIERSETLWVYRATWRTKVRETEQ